MTEQKISIIEEEIKIERNELTNKSIWLFILSVSISSLDDSASLKFFAFLIGFIIYIYYINMIYGNRGDIKSRYKKLSNEIKEENLDASPNYMDKIELSECKSRKVPLFGYSVFMFSTLFYIISFFIYLSS